MTPPISSLNAERARMDALAGNGPANGEARNGAFADLLRGLGQGLPPAAPPAQTASAPQSAPAPQTPLAAPPGVASNAAARSAGTAPTTPTTPEPPAQNEADARDRPQHTAAAGTRAAQRRASDTSKAAQAEQETDGTPGTSKANEAGDQADPSAVVATAAASSPPPADPGATLAHWLLGTAAAGRAAVGDTLPPPSQSSVTGEGMDAASFTQDLLQGLRGAAGKGSERSWVKPGIAASVSTSGAGAPAVDDDEAQGGIAGAHALHAGLTSGLAQIQDVATERPGTDRLGERLGAPGGAAEFAGNAALAATGLQEPAAVRSMTTAVVEQTIQTPVGAAGFGDEVAVSISRLAVGGVHEARLQLNPAELGPLAVHIEVADGAARIGIGAAHEATRQLLEATLPALADAFKADGLTLASSQVDTWSPQSPPDALAGSGFDAAGFGAGGESGGRGAQQQASSRADAYGSAVGAVGAYGSAAGAAAGAGVGIDPLWSGTARRGLGGLDLYA